MTEKPTQAVSAKENLLDFYWHRPIQIMPLTGPGEATIYPVNGFEERPPYDKGGTDWFGCAWEYMEAAGAPAPDCSQHVLDDICDWREVVEFPDLDAWDWERAAKLDGVDGVDRDESLVDVVVLIGLWERLHVLMGFEEALCALLEEPEEVGAFFDAMVEHKIKLIEKLAEHYQPDAITFHDDWGTQTGPFFSPETWRELIKPRQKRIIDAAHEHGIAFIQHSCGKYDDIIPDLPEIGVDVLQCMDINDIGAALAQTGNAMSYLVSVHSQEFFSDDSAGVLTPDGVREKVRREFREWGASGRYAPFIFPPATWYEEIVLEEYERVRQELAGAHQERS